MNVPAFVLLGFAGWTVLTLFGSIGVYRWSRILTGRASISEWRADAPQGSERYQRAMRAPDGTCSRSRYECRIPGTCPRHGYFKRGVLVSRCLWLELAFRVFR